MMNEIVSLDEKLKAKTKQCNSLAEGVEQLTELVMGLQSRVSELESHIVKFAPHIANDLGLKA